MQNSMGKYLDRDSLIHKLNSTFKLVSLIIMLISAFFINSIKDVIMLLSYLILVLFNSNINMKIFIKEIGFFKLFILFILIIDILTFNTIEVLFVDLFRFIFIILYILLFMHVTTTNEIMYAVGRVLDPFSIKKDDDIILYTALIFRFPSVYKDELNRITRLYNERNSIKQKSLNEIITYYIKIRIKAFNLTISKLNRISIDMKIKLFGYGKSRTNNRLNNFGVKEVLLLILNISILTVVIIY